MNLLADVIAGELNVRTSQVQAAIDLLDEGATVPFIARYRKEVTSGLDDAQLRHLEERLDYLRELEKRRTTVINSIQEQGKMSPELATLIEAATTRQELEDLYLPYRPKRRTKAQLAREAGLTPLADMLLADSTLEPEEVAQTFINTEAGFENNDAVLEGARQILMEYFAEDAKLSGRLRDRLWQHGLLVAKVVPGKEEEGARFSDYFDFQEPLAKIPSHRTLALFRGRNLEVLTLDLLPSAADEPDAEYLAMLYQHFSLENMQGAGADWMAKTILKAWRIKLLTRLGLELKNQVLEQAGQEAIRVFARNLKALLLAAPAGRLPIIGLDPGIRTGVKVAVIDNTGQVTDTTTIYPHQPRNQWDESIHTLFKLAAKHGVHLCAIGNGTASRETEKLVRDLAKQHPEIEIRPVVVSEAGASVYSASVLASHELPQLDVSLRGAVSIARRLQDPLAELVKIEPKAIGVGQYQHDVNQAELARMLDTVVEDCVNSVGVDLNTASASLLAQVSGLDKGLAERIVEHRNTHGAFADRKALMKVTRFGPKVFELSAGFLRIPDGQDPLDRSAVHPEAYPVVHRIAEFTGRDVRSLIGDQTLLHALDPARFTDERFGLPTVQDIICELEKPGRDPRGEFKTVSFKEGVESIGDLRPDMVLEGVVTNVTNFGAFVDIGVHQDGLVHISMLADKFVKDPHEVVKSGDQVKVRVLEVDLPRKRIALTMRLGDSGASIAKSTAQRSESQQAKGGHNIKHKPTQATPKTGKDKTVKPEAVSAFGSALADAFKKRG